MTDPFVSIADLEDLLGQSLTGDDLAVIVLDAACEIVRGYLDNPVNLVEDEEIAIDGTGSFRLILPRPPVREVASVSEEDEALTPGDDYVLERGGVLRRVGQRWPRGYGNLSLVYTHGWDLAAGGSWEQVPADIRMVALSLAGKLYASGGGSAAAAGAVVEESVGGGDYRVKYSEGLIASLAGQTLSIGEQSVLDRYRDIHVGPVFVSVPESS